MMEIYILERFAKKYFSPYSSLINLMGGAKAIVKTEIFLSDSLSRVIPWENVFM
jgi:hypothetical protein